MRISDWSSDVCSSDLSFDRSDPDRNLPSKHSPRSRRKLPWYLRPFKWLLWFIALSVLWVLVYAVVPPPVTLPMLLDRHGITKDWESLSNLDRNMVRGAIAAADAKFCNHDGYTPKASQEKKET